MTNSTSESAAPMEVRFFLYNSPEEQQSEVKSCVKRDGYDLEIADPKLGGDIFTPDGYDKIYLHAEPGADSEALVWNPATGEAKELSFDTYKGVQESDEQKAQALVDAGWKEVDKRRGVEGKIEWRYYFRAKPQE